MIDIQTNASISQFTIQSVGVTGLKYPLQVQEPFSGEIQSVQGQWQLAVDLAPDRRGTHMSRFIEELQTWVAEPFELDRHLQFTRNLRHCLESDKSEVRTAFTWFRPVQAPVSQKSSLLPIACEFQTQAGDDERKTLSLRVPATALCPCSKAISDRGAHSQRSDISAVLSFPVDCEVPGINKLVAVMESSASSAVYPLLKRADEKHVTELAYDNPTFVEDVVRNLAERFFDLPDLQKFEVSAINRESIHAHDCFAKLSVVRK